MIDRIEELMKKNNISIKELAEKLNINKSGIYRWHDENRQPTTKQVIEMAKIFNTTTDYILIGINEKGEEKENIIIEKYYKCTDKEKKIIDILLEID